MKNLKDIFEGIFDNANKNNVGKDLEPYSELEIIKSIKASSFKKTDVFDGWTYYRYDWVCPTILQKLFPNALKKPHTLSFGLEIRNSKKTTLIGGDQGYDYNFKLYIYDEKEQECVGTASALTSSLDSINKIKEKCVFLVKLMADSQENMQIMKDYIWGKSVAAETFFIGGLGMKLGKKII